MTGEIMRQRANYAEECLRNYRDAHKDDGLDVLISSFLADVMYLCELRGISFDDMLSDASTYFRNERRS